METCGLVLGASFDVVDATYAHSDKLRSYGTSQVDVDLVFTQKDDRAGTARARHGRRNPAGLGYLRGHVRSDFEAARADAGADGGDGELAPQGRDRRAHHPRHDPPPPGVDGRHVAGAGVREQNRNAVRDSHADRHRCGRRARDDRIGLDGRALGEHRVGLDDAPAVHLLDLHDGATPEERAKIVVGDVPRRKSVRESLALEEGRSKEHGERR